MTVTAFITQLRFRWRRHGLEVAGGAIPATVTTAEARLGVRLAEPLRELYAAMDGSPDSYDLDVPVRLWPLAELDWETVGVLRLVLFADFLVHSREYGFDPETALVYYQDLGPARPGIPLERFLQMLLDDADELYG